MRPIVMRGLSEPNGSWKTTCMRRRIARSVSRSALSMRAPSSVTAPSAIGCSASSAMPSVVLPEPDSPTMPSVSPRRRRSVARRTASKRRCRNQPRETSKLTRTSRASTSTGASAATGVDGARRPAGEQRLRVAVLRRSEHRRGRPGLDQLAALHHADPVREAAHEVEVVGDEEERHAHLGLQLVEQGEDLRLDRHVEGGRRLVGDQQPRPAGERHRDHRALALAARELVRIGVDAPRRLGDAGAREQRDRARAPRRGRALRAARAPRRSARRSCAAG